MSQKPLLAFAIALILASSGCLGFGDDELEQQENDDNEKQEPVGETNMTSLEKRIEHLESTIAEYELPKVYFQEFNGDDIYVYDKTTNLADDGNLFCWYYEYHNKNSCMLAGVAYDVDGIIISFSWESSESGIIEGGYGSTYANKDNSVSYLYSVTPALDVCLTELIEPVNQTLSLIVYDNDGNSASASYNLDYDSACTVIEPDNTCASDSDCPPGTICQGEMCVEDSPNECEDGEQSEEGGMIRTCNNGQWVNIEPIICPQDFNVTNHVCVPCPEGSTNEPGDDASGLDTTCDTNHLPEIHHLAFAGEFVTNETDYVCLDINVYDEDQDEITGDATWLINGVSEENLPLDECFDLGSYNIAVGDELSVQVTVSDGVDTVTATHAVIIEEEPE